MQASLTEILDAYQGIDTTYRSQIEAAGFPVRAVGAEFFGGAVPGWYDAWRSKTPILTQLEAEAGRA